MAQKIIEGDVGTRLIFRAEIKEKLNGSSFGPSQDFMHMLSRVNISYDDFLGHLRVAPAVWSSKFGPSNFKVGENIEQ